MAKPTKYDPLENAKVTAEKRVSDDATADKKDWLAPSKAPPPVESAPETTPVPPTQQEAPQRALYEVVTSRQVSLGRGQVHRFKVGEKLDPTDYGGEDGLKRLGLDLRKVGSE